MKTRAYYTMIVKEAGEKWSAQFGDYDKEVVKQEVEDEKHNWEKGTKFRIIKTGAKQSDIDSYIEELNDKL